MNTLDLLPIAINIAIATWFIRGYPRLVEEKFDPRRTPRAFTLLVPLIQGLGWLIIVGSIGYLVLRVFQT